jgi:hypothetical protein
VPIDLHGPVVPEEMIERVIATRHVKDCNACKSGKQNSQSAVVKLYQLEKC